tara:strand:- start:1969 stop:3039 length:1071 start_codon:yes stop_codon:yes gene_type:complete
MSLQIKLNASRQAFPLDIDLTLPDQGVTAIFGPSGAGKTSLLRAIAGLDHLTDGEVRFRDQVWQDGKLFQPPHKRPLGYVFQEASLFPHLSVQQNIDYGRKRVTQAVTGADYDQIIALLGLENFLSRRPDQLSGGEKQRVAIARALVLNPALLLMDEPMASLDSGRKQEILCYLEKLKISLSVPMLYISHDMNEVTRLADHLVILEGGRVCHQGPLAQVLARHETLAAYCDSPFSLLIGRVITPRNSHHLTEVAVGDHVIRLPQQAVASGQEIRLHLAAKDISLTLHEAVETSVLNILPCVIDQLDPSTPDGQCLVHLHLGDHQIQAQLSAYSCAYLGLHPGQRVFAQIKAISLVH